MLSKILGLLMVQALLGSTPVFSQECVINGTFNLKLIPWGGNASPNWMVGSITDARGVENIQWPVRGSIQYGSLFVEGRLKGMPVSFDIDVRSVNNVQLVDGFIGDTLIYWSGHSGMFQGNTSCLR